MDKKIKRLATTTIICVLIASIFGTVIVLAPPPDFIFPQLIDVFVINTSDDPVPVEVTDDPLDVTLDEPIDVTLDEPIEVVNTQEFEPFTHWKQIYVVEGDIQPWFTTFFTVPEGKLLVIEFVSAKVDFLAPGDSLDFLFYTVTNGYQYQHYMGVLGPQGRVKIEPDSNPSNYLSKMVKAYCDPGQSIYIQLNRLSRDNAIYVYISMSGYYIDVS